MYDVTDLEVGHEYGFAVKASNSVGDSDALPTAKLIMAKDQYSKYFFMSRNKKKYYFFCTDFIEMRLISLFFSSQLLNRLADLGLDTKQMQPNYCNLISIFTIFSSLLVAELY